MKSGKRTRLHPKPEVEKKMQPITRGAFKSLLKRAIATPALKPAPKSA
jgi:hypothetical protein